MNGWEGPDTIRISGVHGRGRHGVLPAERELGQEFVVDVELAVQTARAGRSDQLEDTVNYADIATQVHARITGEPRSLVEALAHDIAADCLAEPLVEAVRVTVHKPQAPVAVPVADISVTVVRHR